MASIAYRVIPLTLATLAAVLWQLVRDSTQQGDAGDGFVMWSCTIWPPSRKSTPFLALCAALFVLLMQRLFFNQQDSPEAARIRQVKKRLILAQMAQTLKWNEDDSSVEKDSGEDGPSKQEDEGSEAEGKKRPPPLSDLFEMLYDNVEDRHVTEFGIQANEEPYRSTFVLFQERIAEELREAVRYTKLARESLEDESVCAELDAEELKFAAQFLDGTKLTELIDLCENKIQKHFGWNFVPKEELKEAQVAKKECLKNQRKGLRMLVPMVLPLVPMYGISLGLVMFDAWFGERTFHSMATLLDGVEDGTMTLHELGMTCLSNYVLIFMCIFAACGSQAIMEKVTSQFRLRVRSEVMRCMVRQDIAFFDIFPSGILQERLNTDAEMLAGKFFELPKDVVEKVLKLISNASVVFNLRRQLFWLIFVPLPIVSVVQYFIFKFMEKIGERQRKIAEHAAAGTLEVLKEIRTVREFAMEVEEAEKFHVNSSYRAGIEEFGQAMNNIVFMAPLICIFVGSRMSSTYFAGAFVSAKSMTVGQAIQVGFIADHMQHVIRDLMMMVPEIVKIMSPLGRVCDMLASEPKIEPRPSDKPGYKPDKLKGHIVFDKVDFTYPAEPLKQILFKVSFEVKPGERVAFVGSSGSGKSSAIRLIERFYAPTAGIIMLDGRRIEEYDLYHLRRHMSVVAQDNMLFSTTLRENITYGLPREQRETITDHEIEEVCKKANAWTFINEFPRKLETLAGERGVKLSGGQKQRLAIARAIIRRPSIILLDEATSALDGKAEGVVQRALDGMINENTDGCTIVIAHRLTTIKDCDSIMVLDKGKIMEKGTHEELLAVPIKKSAGGETLTGWYHDLWSTQMGNDDTHRLQYLERRVKMLEGEVERLLRQPTPGKLGHAKRKIYENKAPQPLTLHRATSDVTDPKQQIQTPTRLSLDRARSTVL